MTLFDPAPEPLDIEVFVLPDTTLILLSSIIEPLRAANRISGSVLYRWTLSTLSGKPETTTCGLPAPADRAFAPDAARVPLFVIASYRTAAHATAELKRRLNAAARSRPVIGGFEGGAWLLAHAGLLDQRAATTHWEDLDDFAARFDRIDVRAEPYVIDRDRLTAAGAMPSLDLMLELIRRRQGAALAREVSRLFIYQRSPAEILPAAPVGDARVDTAIKLMQEHIEDPLSVAQVAATVGISLRQLQYLFADVMGSTVQQHYATLRLNTARRLLRETRRSCADIAASTGYNSAAAFIRAYGRRFGESPTASRRAS